MGLYGSPDLTSINVSNENTKKNKNMIYCTSCGFNYSKKIVKCPKCGKKCTQPFYHNWWFWAFAVIMFFTIFFSPSNNDANMIDDISKTTVEQIALSEDKYGVSQTEIIYSQAEKTRIPEESTEPIHTHSYSDATCTKASICSCGATSGSALGHSYNQGICSRCGDADSNYNPISISKQNALKKAKAYLDCSAFSYSGLVNQLEYEKFSHEDAIYGVDNCGAIWNEQALKKAKAYLDCSAFSYSGLVNQLKYEKFTSEQAKFGADNCGANWNQQAAKKAESYLVFSSFSRQALIDQLKYEGFTQEQAIYGVDSVGL